MRNGLNTRYVRVAGALALALGAALAAPGTIGVGADAVNSGGLGGCVWTSFPNAGALDQGCAYVATTTLGEVVWSGLTTATPTVTGASSAPACVASGAVGVCTYGQAVGVPIGVAVPGSVAGIAGAPQAGGTIGGGGSGTCAWLPPSPTCTIQVPLEPQATTLHASADPASVRPVNGVALISWANSAPPQVTVTGADSIVSCTPASGVGGCVVELRLDTSLYPAGVATITVTADPGSDGVLLGAGEGSCVSCGPGPMGP